jgi:L-threonylcarbamoyladenylate synthase
VFILKTKIKIVEEIEDNIEVIKEASEVIKKGGTVVFPTETVYGLGANALDEEAVNKIFIAKGRPQDNPLIVHVCSKDITKYVESVPDVAQKLIDKFWPGPLTVILNKKSIIPDVTSAGLKSIGIRMPKNAIALKLIELSNVPIAAPSANISGRPSPTDVKRCIEDLSGRVDYIIGGKSSEVGVESTIVDCTVYPPLVLRPGGITLEMLRKVDKNINIDKAILSKPDENLKPKAPGMKYRHYAPKAVVQIISGDNKKVVEKINEMIDNYRVEGKKVGVLASNKNSSVYKTCEVKVLGDTIEKVAQNLFEALRGLDDLGVDIILSESFEEKGLGIAVMNRLNKAAGFHIINV